MDISTLLGLTLGFGGILLGQVLEGGHIGSIVQGTAGLIVLGGTLGATFVGSTMEDLKTAVGLLRFSIQGRNPKAEEKIIKEIIESAQIARKESILSLERKIPMYSDPYMQTVFRFVVDGVDANTIEDIFSTQIAIEEEHLNAGAKVYVDAGGFAPTIGIIGAVLGLIHVMENLSDTSKLGAGIAVAFVATVYGVGSANLLLLPLGNKIKRNIKLEMARKEMILIGAHGIISGLNPFIIEEKLRAFLSGAAAKERTKKA